MNVGWKYVSFEDCLERIPKVVKIQSSEYQQSGTYPIISQEESFISGFWDNSDDVLQIEHPVVIFGDHTRVLKYVDFNFVIGADGVKILSPKSFLFPKFLYYYLKEVNIPSLGYSRHYKLLKEITIPVPPLAEQEQIVGELDLLAGIIDKQKTQLKELDTLAQSIFYSTFGDPIENEKGWEVKKLEEVGEIVSGSTPSTSDESNWNGNINWVTPAELGLQLFYGETERKITAQAAEKLTMMPAGTVLLSSRAPIGKLAITTVPMCCNQGFKNIVCGITINNIFLYYYLMLAIDNIKALGRGATFKEVSKQAIANYKIPVPPLELQNAFAEKIENIERQKEVIARAITETQKLFDYTMDKYFG